MLESAQEIKALLNIGRTESNLYAVELCHSLIKFKYEAI